MPTSATRRARAPGRGRAGPSGRGCAWAAWPAARRGARRAARPSGRAARAARRRAAQPSSAGRARRLCRRASSRRRRRVAGRRFGFGGRRQLDAEAGAAADLALDGDATTELLDGVADEREADAGAGAALGREERIEDARQEVLGDAVASVLDVDDDAAVAA